jgi:hypothetical protein
MRFEFYHAVFTGIYFITLVMIQCRGRVKTCRWLRKPHATCTTMVWTRRSIIPRPIFTFCPIMKIFSHIHGFFFLATYFPTSILFTAKPWPNFLPASATIVRGSPRETRPPAKEDRFTRYIMINHRHPRGRGGFRHGGISQPLLWLSTCLR